MRVLAQTGHVPRPREGRFHNDLPRLFFAILSPHFLSIHSFSYPYV